MFSREGCDKSVSIHVIVHLSVASVKTSEISYDSETGKTFGNLIFSRMAVQKKYKT